MKEGGGDVNCEIWSSVYIAIWFTLYVCERVRVRLQKVWLALIQSCARFAKVNWEHFCRQCTHTHTQFINNKMTFHYVRLLCIYSKWEDVVCILVGGGGFGRIVRHCLVNLVTPYVPIS